MKERFRINFSILDEKTDQVFYKIKGMKPEDFFKNIDVIKRKLK